MSKRHWNEIDVLYAVGVLLVILGHSHSSDWSTFKNTSLEHIILFIYTFHMALFFAIAGFLFHNSGSLQSACYLNWLQNKALRLLVPYVFWTIVAIVPKYYVEHHGLNGLNWSCLQNAIFYPRNNVWGHFWFLPVLFLCYAIFGLIHAFFSKKYLTELIVIESIASLALYIFPLKTNLLGLADWTQLAFFFVIGIVANMLMTSTEGKKQSRKKSFVYIRIFSCFLPFAAALLLYQVKPGHWTINLFIALLMLSFCWLIATSLTPNAVIRFLSSHNYTLFMFSWFFQSLVMILCDKLHCNYLVTSTMMFASGIAGPMCVILVYEHLRFMHSYPMRLILGYR